MKKSIKNKIVASILIFILGLANFQGIITEGIAVYASSIENQSQETNHKNVDFNAQFMVINNDKKYSIKENITGSEIYLNIITEIKEAGYLKSGRIYINNANFELIEIEEPYTIQDIDYTKGEIILNQINNGEKLDVNIPIKAIMGESYELTNFSKDSNVVFEATYVDGKGEEKQVEKEINLKVEWKEEVEGVLNQEAVRVLQYELENEKGIIISERIGLGILDGKLPIKLANVNIEVPKMGDILPTDVRVEKLNTRINVKSDYKDGKLNLILENEPSAENTVIWNKNLEEFEISYVFENLEDVSVSEVKSLITAELEVYSGENKKISVENENIINVLEEKGNSIEDNMENLTGIIDKGYMLNTTNETEFKVKSNISIAHEKLVEKIEEIYNKDKFIINEKEVNANTYYKKIIVSQENLNKILGETGAINVYSLDTLLGTIDNNIKADENGNIELVLEKTDISELRIETTKPIYSGILEIEFLKAIKNEDTYTKEEIKNISKLKIESNIGKVNLDMANPMTKIELETNTNILSTVVENQGVELIVTLKNNTLDCDLFKNPKIEIRMPEAVTDLKINGVQLLLEDELVIKNYEYIKDTNSVIVNLEGIQTKYNLNESAYGATIIVNANITLDKLAVNKKDKIKLFVENELSTSYESVLEEKGYSEADVNIVAPLGLIALNSAAGYGEETEEIVSISGNEAVGKIEPNAETKVATMKITAINNYGSIINNIRVLGRIPFIGNKSLIDGSDLGTTFDAILKGEISSDILTAENFDIYYSENGDATEDLNSVENAWTKEIVDLAKVKSYLIVLKEYEMEIGEKLEFKYDIEVPAGLELGNSAHGTYIVYYDNKKDDVVFENSSVPAVVELTTGEAPKLEISINSDISENEVAKSGQIIRYEIKVKNIGSVKANQVFVTTDIPEGLTYAELVLGGNYDDDYYELHSDRKTFNKLIGDLSEGQEETIEFLVKVNEDLSVQKEVSIKAKVSAKNLPEMIESNEIKNLVDKGSLLIELSSNVKENEKLEVGDNVTYTAKIKNMSNYDINNLVATVELPQGITYKNAYIKNSDTKVEYNEKSQTINWNIGKMSKEEMVEIVLETMLNNESKDAVLCVKVFAENVSEHKSNTMKLEICKSNITVRQESTIPEGYVAIGDKIEYKIQVANTGDLDATNIQIIDSIPEGMKYIETTYEINGITKTVKNSNDNQAKLELNVPANETLNMTVKVKANETEVEKQATNVVKVIDNGTEIEANQITHTIEAKTLGNTQNGESSNIDLKDTYKISGTAWFDSNGNGLKDNDEAVLSGITVMLLDKATGGIAKDANAQELSTTTEGTGSYTFRNLNKGEYIVVFIYDNSKYVITDYKKAGIEESKNSDVVNMNITMNGQEKVVAVSDTIIISDGNIYNINIGLKDMPKFDIKLDKYVSKITTKSSKETKVYTYDNTKLAKIEINSSTANDTTLIIEYKLIITNEGSLAGYVKKVADYIPKELKFSSELNTSWYLAEDGNVYNSELSNIKINPGESKELVLVLTKQMTGENTGLVNNNAEIVESYNDYGTEDVDSVAGNKQANEDDMSNADIYIGIKTGSPVTYIGLSIVIMAVLGLGAYLINKKVLNKE